MNAKLTPYRMEDFLCVKHGFPFWGEFFASNGKYIVLTPGNFYEKGGFKRTLGKEKYYCADFPKEYLCSAGDLIVAMTEQAEGLLGSTAIIPESDIYLHNQRIGLITWDDNIIDKLYLYYLFMTRSVRKQIRDTASGTKVKHTSPERIYDVKVFIPDKDVQETSASLLWTIDQKIQLNNLIIAELESMAKTIYDYWFVQFEFPNAEGKPYRASGGEMLWNEQLKQEIPKGWRDTTLSTIIKVEKGGDWGKEQITGNYTEQVICIRGADFPGLVGKQLLNAPIRYILKKNTHKALNDGDIIVEISGGSPVQSTGRVCYINEEVLSRFDLPIITSNFCKAFSLNDQNWLYWFYILWEKLYSSGVFFKYEGKTTGIKNLLFETLCSDYRIIYPAANIVKKYNDFAKALFVDIQKKNLENLELSNLRDWLLPMLMNGQITVD